MRAKARQNKGLNVNVTLDSRLQMNQIHNFALLQLSF